MPRLRLQEAQQLRLGGLTAATAVCLASAPTTMMTVMMTAMMTMTRIMIRMTMTMTALIMISMALSARVLAPQHLLAVVVVLVQSALAVGLAHIHTCTPTPPLHIARQPLHR